MFDHYRSRVLDDYRKKKAGDTLSINLTLPTPARLKNECIRACEKGYLRKDEILLELFFGPQEDSTAYRKAIKKCDTDKFKPLCNFLRGKTGKTDEKNIELLAWLIDFEERPFNVEQSLSALMTGQGVSVSTNEGADDSQETIESAPAINKGSNYLPEKGASAPAGAGAQKAANDLTVKEEEKGTIEIFGVKKDGSISVRPPFDNHEAFGEVTAVLRSRKGMFFSVVLVITCAVSYLVWNHQPVKTVLTGREECMYWAGDHYQPVLCSQKVGTMPVYAIDTIKVAHFKKITEADTITKKAMGIVWYAKINGKIEFYTSNGFHPVYTDKRLRPVTEYIIDKYVHRD